jgi:hypothetical protein
LLISFVVLTMQPACQPEFWRYAPEEKTLVGRATRSMSPSICRRAVSKWHLSSLKRRRADTV